MPLACLALRINEPFSHYNYSVVPPLSGSTSILPAGTRDTLTQTRTHGFGLIAICGTLGAVVDAQRAIRRVTADSYQGHAPSTYRTWLQGIDPRTAGTPAYTSYIGAKVAQHFETGWGVGVVCCIAADPRLKSSGPLPNSSQPFLRPARDAASPDTSHSMRVAFRKGNGSPSGIRPSNTAEDLGLSQGP